MQREPDLSVYVSSDKVRVPVSKKRIEDAVNKALRSEKVSKALISVTFLSPSAIARINKSHLNHSGPTDVISFAFDRSSKQEPVIGDIYICPGVAKKNAVTHGVGIREEILRLVIHGTLHVLGYDHPVDEKRVQSAMWRKQEAILQEAILARLD